MWVHVDRCSLVPMASAEPDGPHDAHTGAINLRLSFGRYVIILFSNFHVLTFRPQVALTLDPLRGGLRWKRALSTMLFAQLSGISRRRAVLYTCILASLLLAYHHFAHPKVLTSVAPPPYIPFASRECDPGQPCARTELDALIFDKQGVLPSAGSAGQKLSCSPPGYSNGSWAFRPSHPGTVPDRMRYSLDAVKFAGFDGCASSRQVAWALGADMPEQWDRFPNVTSWDWVPGESCEGLELWNKEKMVRHLVQDGGWLLIGGKSAIVVPLCLPEKKKTERDPRFGDREPFLFPLVSIVSPRNRHSEL